MEHNLNFDKGPGIEMVSTQKKVFPRSDKNYRKY